MKKKIDLKWLLDNHFVRMVGKEVIPNLGHFDFLTHVEIGDSLRVFFYISEIDGDLLVYRREAYYIKSQDEFIHFHKIHVYLDITAAQFQQMVEGNIIDVHPDEGFTSLSEKEQVRLLALENNKNK